MMRDKLPKRAFDMEYSTQYRKQMLYLKDKGIHPVFIKKTADYHVTTYKYTKTAKLFEAVKSFYEQEENTKTFNDIVSKVNSVRRLMTNAEVH